MQSEADLIVTYIRAKDCNRPHLLGSVFAEDAILEIICRTDSVSFPAQTSGLAAIADVVSTRFGQTFENVYTFCLAAPPVSGQRSFSCGWLVGMSEKQGGAVRVGCGRYDWSFRLGGAPLVERLAITIETMPALPPHALPAVMQWLCALPYPWCPVGAARTAPPFEELHDVAGRLRERDA